MTILAFFWLLLIPLLPLLVFVLFMLLCRDAIRAITRRWESRHRGLVAQFEVVTHDAHKAEIQQAAKRLGETWKEWQGEDSLHEMAFGEP
jgi:hypothetical protein